MQEALIPILDIQELDMKMIRLMRLKNERLKELSNLNRIKGDLNVQVSAKAGDITEMKRQIKAMELEIEEVNEKIKKLETQQNNIKKVDEFNALTHEVSGAEKQRHAKEQILSDLYDKLAAQEDQLKNLQGSMDQTESNSKQLEEEIYDSIRQINSEGIELKTGRDKMVEDADREVFAIYERLLCNKKNRVVVPIENRCCSGCHIMLTAQHENLVRKGERLVFCEHCSRIHYWPESEAVEGTQVATKRRRRPSKV